MRVGLLLWAFVLLPLRAQEGSFGSGLYQVMEKAACRSCHTADGVASPTRLHFPEPDADPDKIEAFGRSLVNLVDREHPERSLLLNKPTNRIPHAGGERIKPGSQDEAILKAWIQRLTQLSGVELARALKYREEENSGGGQAAPRTDLRRLTHSQYDHTVRDLLGDQTSPAEPISARGLHQRLPESIAGAESFAAADRILQRGCRAAGPQRVSRRRHARADPVQTVGRLRARVSFASSD